jgi:hypothetical protein
VLFGFERCQVSDLRRTSKSIALGNRNVLKTLRYSRILEFFSKSDIGHVVTVEATMPIESMSSQFRGCSSERALKVRYWTS